MCKTFFLESLEDVMVVSWIPKRYDYIMVSWLCFCLIIGPRRLMISVSFTLTGFCIWGTIASHVSLLYTSMMWDHVSDCFFRPFLWKNVKTRKLGNLCSDLRYLIVTIFGCRIVMPEIVFDWSVALSMYVIAECGVCILPKQLNGSHCSITLWNLDCMANWGSVFIGSLVCCNKDDKNKKSILLSCITRGLRKGSTAFCRLWSTMHTVLASRSHGCSCLCIARKRIWIV